jgi:carbamoylphosphate synthase large subunit
MSPASCSIEEAGIHSGDSACSLPAYTLTPAMVAELERQAKALAIALKVGGLMNVQFALQGNDIYVLEVNPRASRTVPFVAKPSAGRWQRSRRASWPAKASTPPSRITARRSTPRR